MIREIRLRRAHIELVSPFRTSFGVETARELLYLEVHGDGITGWGECVAMSEPMYSSEFVDGCEAMLRRFLLPLVTPTTTAEQFTEVARQFRGHYMAKAVLETALLDHQLRAQGVSLGTFLGATKARVPSGVSVGIQPTIDDLLRVVQGYLDDGYLRIKLKIEPGFDVEPVRAVRRAFGDELLLQVDANSAYAISDAEHLAQLDQFNLLLIEQPLPEEQVASHADLARVVRTPICLDESILSVEVAREALDIGACSIINIKPGRVGGYLEAKKIHDLCYERGVAVWCGGMLETGIGRAANLALAAMPGFTLPGDTSASARYFHRDVTTPFVLRDGHLDVPTGPGIGCDPDLAYLDSITSRVDTVLIAG
ncbi:MAG: o-succinylbenzoate synthase [Actinobacteria bacterium]|nr:o-succinylbenzoate synthase [Actinomycetota bacterium]NBY58374.1 o-succinylbenzoate synthase [Actinomycetota bacterium]